VITGCHGLRTSQKLRHEVSVIIMLTQEWGAHDVKSIFFKIVTILLSDSLRDLIIEFSTTVNRLFKVISNQVNIEYISYISMLHACVLYHSELLLHFGKIVHFRSPAYIDILHIGNSNITRLLDV